MSISDEYFFPLGGSANYVQLLTNGKVLFVLSDLRTYVLEPSADGRYRTGTMRRVQDVPYSALYCSILMLSNGKVVQTVGEYGTSLTSAVACVFDPETEKWTEFINGTYGHRPINIADDGRAFSAFLNWPPNSPPLATTFSDNAFAILPPESESELVLTPSGKFVAFDGSGSSMDYCIISPGYSTEFITAGSASGARVATKTDQSSLFNPQGLHWRLPNSSLRLSWFSTGPVTNYEHGVVVWSTVLNRPVMFTGNGYIISKADGENTTTGALDRYCFMGMEPEYPDIRSKSVYAGNVSATDSGKSPFTMATQGTMSFTLGPGVNQGQILVNLNTSKTIFIRVSGNTSWVCFQFTSASVVGSTCTLTGLILHPTYPGNIGTGILSAGDQICLGRPSYQCMDAPACILPNGTIIFAAGVESIHENGDFNSAGEWLKWSPGNNFVSFLDSTGKGSMRVPEYAGSAFPLPDGDILLHSGFTFRFYTPTNQESTPVTNSRPVITSGDVSVRAGYSFTLTGNGLNGVHEGGYFGDDRSPRTNFPIVRLRNQQTNAVYLCHTKDFTYRGIQPLRPSSCNVIVPSQIPAGAYTLEVIANGVSSITPTTVTVLATTNGEPTFLSQYGG